MHRANHYYGHSQVLARYCHLADAAPDQAGSGRAGPDQAGPDQAGPDRIEPPRIHGYLQHGWNIGDGLAADHEFVAGTPVFVWSERTRRRAWSLGRRQTYVVGSPWAYLLRMEPDPGGPREGTVWYPFHGWEGQPVVGDHERLIAAIRATEPGPVTVCLYWQEFRSRWLRRRYERAGFRVICHGYRGDVWGNRDPQFLYRQLAEQRRHRRVASNRLSSAVLYGVLAGCEPAVYGDPMQLSAEIPYRGGQQRVQRQWPQLHGEQVDVAVAREIAAAELGADRLVPPAEMRRLFGWPDPAAAAGEVR